MKGLAVVPTDWLGEYIDYVVRWPSSDQWEAILRGQLTDPAFVDFWDLFTGDPTASQEAMAATFDTNLHLEEGAVLPAGIILNFAGTVIPNGWLECDFSEVSRTTYARLFAAIGTTYGSGDGTTTFNLPAAAGRVVVGLDITDADFNALGDFGGQKSVTLEVSEMPEHTHTQTSHNHTQNSHNHVQDAHNHVQDAHNHVQDAHAHTIWGALDGSSGAAKRTMQAASGANNAASGNTTATNQATTPTNQATTPTNQATTATNQATTATNQNEGGGNPHNNLQPYIIFKRIIKA